MTAALVLLGHQGGWDEALMVLAPIAVFAFLLHKANGRAARLTAPPEDRSEDRSEDQSEDQSEDRGETTD